MRFEAKTCFGAALFLGVTALIYWLWSREQTGTVCLVFGFCAYALIGGYFYQQWRRRNGIPRAEDREDAEPADGAGEIGFFPAASIWPAGLGLGGISLAIGLIYGTWYWAIGAVLLTGSIIGFVVEAEAREEGPDDPGATTPSGEEIPEAGPGPAHPYRRDY